MRLQNPTLCLLAALAAAAPGFALADPAAPPKAPSEDVTITVVPAGQDVMRTVVQTITVPAGKKTTRVPKASTAVTARSKEEKETLPAAQHEDMSMTSAEEAAQQAQQQVQQQAQQAQQQAQEQRQKHAPPVQQPPPGQPPPPGQQPPP